MFNKKSNFFSREKQVNGLNTLSMSDAQALSNVCNQKAASISAKLNQYNNFTKTFDLSSLANAGQNNNSLIKVKPFKIVYNDVELLLVDLGKYHAFQAFLMEHIKLKEILLRENKEEMFNESLFEDRVIAELGEAPDFDYESPTIAAFQEKDAWEDIARKDILNFVIANSTAAAYGNFIHKDTKLDRLRKELPKVPEYEFEELPDGRVGIVEITTHHTIDELEDIHIKLSDLHRDQERIVNAVKANVKNKLSTLTDDEDLKYAAEIQIYRDKREKYLNELGVYRNNKAKIIEKERLAFNLAKSERLNEIVNYRIQVPAEFTSIITEFNKK